MANRPFQGYTLFQMLKAAKPDEVVSRSAIAKKLGVNEGSVPIYFFGLKKYFGVEFEVVKNGRAVIGYKLISRDIDVPENGRRTSGSSVKKTAKPAVSKTMKSVAKVTKTKAPRKSKNAAVEVEDLEVTEISDQELSDIKNQLGLA